MIEETEFPPKGSRREPHRPQRVTDIVVAVPERTLAILPGLPPMNGSRDTAARRCRAGRKQAVRQAFALAARARGDAQFSAHRSGCDAQESRKSGRPAIPNGDGAAVPAGLPRVIRNPLRIGPAAIRKILLLGLGVDSACS